MKFCRKPGCNAIVSKGFCEAHKPRGRTGSKNPFYGSAAWKKLRAWHITTQEPLCRMCGAAGEVVDHVVEIGTDGGGCDPLDASNLQTLCRKCHEAKSNRFKPKEYSYGKVQTQSVNAVFRF